jgi:hypothetical protein
MYWGGHQVTPGVEGGSRYVRFEWTIAWVRGRRRPEPRAETGKSVPMARIGNAACYCGRVSYCNSSRIPANHSHHLYTARKLESIFSQRALVKPPTVKLVNQMPWLVVLWNCKEFVSSCQQAREKPGDRRDVYHCHAYAPFRLSPGSAQAAVSRSLVDSLSKRLSRSTACFSSVTLDDSVQTPLNWPEQPKALIQTCFCCNDRRPIGFAILVVFLIRNNY